MASISLEFAINADAARVWEVIGDWAHGPTRMAPGYVVSSDADGDVRVVTFANGTVVRERLVTLDAVGRRLAYSVVGDTMRPEHDNAVMQVVADGAGQCRFLWSRDLLPDDLAGPLRAAMEDAGAVIGRTLSAPE
jgi:Polyketide cyclase / dehydrase and lipid transport